MTPLTCAEVEERIDLYALRECDPHDAEAVAAHLAGCRSCARTYQEARLLLGLLDLDARQDEGLARLRGRIAAESWRVARTRSAAVRRVLALAALLLLTLGLTWWAEPGAPVAPPSEDEILIARLAPHDAGVKAPAVEIAPAAARHMADGTGPEVTTEFVSADFRRDLEEGRRTGRLPPPPAVSRDLRLRNTGRRELVLLLEEGKFRFRIDLQGPRVVRIPVQGEGLKPFTAPGKVRVPPGGTCVVPVVRLSEDLDGKLRYVYWTEPGRYTLSVRLEVGAEGRNVPLTAATPPVAVQVRVAP
jgi:hypothetical protein